MRLRVAAAMTAVCLLMVVAVPGAAAGGKPERFPVGDQHVTYPAGFLCPFAVKIDAASHSLKGKAFPVAKNGDQTVKITGTGIVTVTNLATGELVNLRTSFRQVFTFHADTTVTVHTSGSILIAFYPVDVGGPGLFYFKGHTHQETLADFTFLEHEATGVQRDMCAELAA